MLDTTDGLPPSAEAGDLTRYVAELRDRGAPAVLSINGKGQLVVNDPATYAKLLELVDRIETLEGVRESLAEYERGEGRPAADIFEDIRQKHNIPRDA